MYAKHQIQTLQRMVEINAESNVCRKTASKNNRKELVFHELGHCCLRRIAHKNDTFEEGTLKSNMVNNNTDLYSPRLNAINDDGTLGNKTIRRKYHKVELFDEKTRSLVGRSEGK